MKKVLHPLDILQKDELWSDNLQKAAKQIYEVCFSIVNEEMSYGITDDYYEPEYIA
jgi:hypothetical protein